MGDITVELYKDRAPVSVENFLRYVAEGFYPGTIFHRVVKNFVIQGGGYLEGMIEKQTHEPIQNEATNGLKNLRGTLAMARTQTLRSATSQFYINVANNSALDHRGYTPSDFGYAVFGRVLSGMEVADKIAEVATKAENPIETGDDQERDASSSVADSQRRSLRLTGRRSRPDSTGRGSRGSTRCFRSPICVIRVRVQ